ncbi:MmpS family transport accessory protein [Microbispora sp. NPDC088329]|uniref:MmpS family transport accessory protein n=1 Tax=Microbispora sp. NPDC088329 TaxID=3154869 RepID=UPI003433F4B9
MAYSQGPPGGLPPQHGQAVPPRRAAGLAIVIAVLAVVAVAVATLGVLIAAGVIGSGAQPGTGATEVAQLASTAAAATPEPTAHHTVTFEVVSRDEASSLARVSWSAKYSDGGLGMGGGDRVELPYAETVPYGDPMPQLELWVFNAGADDVLICRIRVDGSLVAEESSKGYYNHAFCQVPAQ